MCERSFSYMRLKTRVQPLCIRVSLSKNLVEFRRRSGEKSQIIFSGDMCGGENTARPANVRAVRRRRTARAMQSGRSSLPKSNPFGQRNRERGALPVRLYNFIYLW